MSDVKRPSSQELRDTLERLRDLLETTEVTDPETRRLLEELSARTGEFLDAPEAPPRELRSTLHQGLLGAVERFEGTHPDLAAVIGKVADLLSGLGI